MSSAPVEMWRTFKSYLSLWPGYFDNAGEMAVDRRLFAFVGLVLLLPVMLIVFLSFFTISLPFYVISKADSYRSGTASI